MLTNTVTEFQCFVVSKTVIGASCDKVLYNFELSCYNGPLILNMLSTCRTRVLSGFISTQYTS
jgi:hypothetical protein